MLHHTQSVPMLDETSALHGNMPQHNDTEGGKQPRLAFSPASSVWGQMGRAWTTGGRGAPHTTEVITENDYVVFFHQFFGLTKAHAIAEDLLNKDANAHVFGCRSLVDMIVPLGADWKVRTSTGRAPNFRGWSHAQAVVAEAGTIEIVLEAMRVHNASEAVRLAGMQLFGALAIGNQTKEDCRAILKQKQKRLPCRSMFEAIPSTTQRTLSLQWSFTPPLLKAPTP